MQLTIFFINARLELEWHLKIISQRLTFLLYVFTVFQNGEVQKLDLLFHKVTRLGQELLKYSGQNCTQSSVKDFLIDGRCSTIGGLRLGG